MSPGRNANEREMVKLSERLQQVRVMFIGRWRASPHVTAVVVFHASALILHSIFATAPYLRRRECARYVRSSAVAAWPSRDSTRSPARARNVRGKDTRRLCPLSAGRNGVIAG